jgi:hypothetical protein
VGIPNGIEECAEGRIDEYARSSKSDYYPKESVEDRNATSPCRAPTQNEINKDDARDW